MKKSIILSYLFIFILSTTCLFAQPDWQWGQEVRFNAGSIAVDNYGNSYVTWSLQDTYEIDGEEFISHGAADIALTSFDCDGTHRWTKTFGGQSSDVSSYVGTDTLGGVYLVGRFTAMGNYDVHISNDTVISGYTNKGFFLTKYNIEGEFQWFRMPEDTAILDITNIQLAGPLDLSVAPNGDCHIFSRLPVGTYGNEVYVATQEATPNSSNNLHVLNYDREGNCTGGLHLDVWYDGGLSKTNFIRDHHTGKYYMSGYLSGNDVFIFGGEEVNANNYVVQFDSDGFVNWRISADDEGIGHTFFVGKPSVDDFGNVYISGDSYNSNSFGGFLFNNTINTSNFPIFAKIDSLGNVVYATNASVPGVSKGKATTYSNNQVGLTGSYVSEIHWGDITHSNPENNQLTNVFLTFFEPLGNGLPTDMNVLYGSTNGNEYPSLLTSDRQGNFYVGGNFSGQLHVGDGTLYNQYGTQEGFIAKFGTDSCYCPLPAALFAYDSIPNQAGYNFAYTGSTDADSVTWDFGDGQTGSGFNTYHFFAESGDYTVCATAYNDCGTDTVCLTLPLLGPVGLSKVAGMQNIRLYPNPAREMLYIEHDVPGSRVHVINAVGQLVLSTTLPAGAAQVDVSQWPAGLYILRFAGRKGTNGYARFAVE